VARAKGPAELPGTTDRRIDALLALLAENPMLVLSGAKIAREIGVTRSTVWRWVERLRGLGVRVRAHRGAGYRIERVPDVLVPKMLRPRLAGTAFARRIVHFFRTGSTNDLAFALGEAGEPHGALVIAEEQTAGRGRAGRAWHSEKSAGIYLSVLLRPPIPPAAAPLLTLLAGLAVRDAVAEQTGLEADLRWPNDLLAGGKKFCGILTEMHAEPDRVRFVVVGLGLNVNHQRFPGELDGIATSLRLETGRAVSRLELAWRLLRRLDHDYNRFLERGAADVVERFAAASSYARGKRVRITTATESFLGTTDGLEPSGVLRVRRDPPEAGVELVLSGDVAEA
jgi:BirA family transcriptional regulator, biotin operon repressor / biotin---[acetyl-CoA-carboxylase] ligase